MQIPIENIYYLLSYAWNKLDEKDQVTVDIDDKTELLDLFAKILIRASKILVKRGIDRQYLSNTDEHAGIKGKLELSATLKSRLHLKQRTICTFDEFSPNTLANRIVVTTLMRLIKTNGLQASLKSEIKNVLLLFPAIDEVQINQSHFRQIRLNRNNKFYGFVLSICQIVYENMLPSEKSGTWKFADFTRDEKKMNQLFEAFIRNFYTMEQSNYKVRRENIEWDFKADEESKSFLPQMQTDITLENDDAKIIIDAKYYRETMSIHYEKERIKSHNLYQLFSYLVNQKDGSEKSKSAKGILVYSTVSREYNLSFIYDQHALQIKTLNLNERWDKIAERLKDIIR